jgi:hypothetical protein
MALETLRTLSEADVSLLQGALDRMRRLPGAGPTTGGGDDYFTPETYIVLTPVGGIPARVGIIPGVAECQVYRLAERPGGLMYLDLVFGLTKPVYNLSLGVLPGNDYLPATRDKFGSWLTTCCGSVGTAGPGSGEGGPDGGGGGARLACACCPTGQAPATIIGTVTTGTNEAAEWQGSVWTFTGSDGLTWHSELRVDTSGRNIQFRLECPPGVPGFQLYNNLCGVLSGPFGIGNPTPASSCDPFDLTITGANFCDYNTASMTWHFTE